MSDRYSKKHMRRDEYEEQQKAGRINPAAVVIMAIMILGIIAIVLYSYFKRQEEYTGWQIESSARIPEGEAKYLYCDDGFIRYTTDGAECRDIYGKALWNVSYNMKNPVADACGSYAVFADSGNQNVCVTDGKGGNQSISAPYAIEQVCVAANGTVAIRADAGERDHIYLYSYTGEMLLDIETSVKKAGFPMTIALSPDGRKLVTSYVKVGEEQESWLTFYNFGDVGQNYADKIVGSFSYDGRIVPEVRFVNDNTVWAFVETGCDVYSFSEIPEKTTNLSFTGGVAGICCSDTNVVVAEPQTDGACVLHLFESAGNLQKNITTTLDFEWMHLTEEELYLVTGATGLIYRFDGTEKLRTRFNENVKILLPGSDVKSEYVVVSNGRIETIKLIKVKDLEE